MSRRFLRVLLLGFACAGQASAGAAPDQVATTHPAKIAIPPSLAAPACEIAAGTVVDLEIAQPLSSMRQKRGDKFAIRLRHSIAINGIEVVRAGTEGVGEIVHAEPASSGGKPGELLLAARYLDHDDSQLRLRALKFGATGKDNSALAAGASVALGPLALFIHGRNIEIPLGTLVNAKVAENIALPDCSSHGERLPDASPASTVPPQTPPSTDPSIQE